MSQMFPLVDNAADWERVCDALWIGNEMMVSPRFNFRQARCYVPGGLNWVFDFPNGYCLSIRQYGEGSYSNESTVELLAYGWADVDAPDTWDDARGWQTLGDMTSAIVEVYSYPNIV